MSLLSISYAATAIPPLAGLGVVLRARSRARNVSISSRRASTAILAKGWSLSWAYWGYFAASILMTRIFHRLWGRPPAGLWEGASWRAPFWGDAPDFSARRWSPPSLTGPPAEGSGE